MTFFWSRLKQGQDLENRAIHPHQEFPGLPPPLPNYFHKNRYSVGYCLILSEFERL